MSELPPVALIGNWNAGWWDGEAAKAWTPTKPDAAASPRHRRVRVIRDYGMSDRREPPQFYPVRRQLLRLWRYIRLGKQSFRPNR